MAIHTRLRTCLFLVGVLLLSGCGDSAPSLLAVKAVAAGVPSLAPFFDEGEQLGRDEPDLRSLEPHSGLQQGNTPGLYGGTQKPKICDVGKLEDFLTARENKKKAQEWARIVGIDVDGIERYLDELTPVLLRHDTLVKNHDYKKGKAVPFDALLEAGIAVLVDDQGLPAVKCSCGNPLRAFDENPERIKVEFAGDHKEWKGYDEARVVVVKPAPEQLKEIKLVDVENPDQGISREVGTTGEADTTFDTRVRQAVPKVRGMTFGEASAAMAGKGLAVTVAGDALPPGDAPVTGSSPGAGAELEFGAAVALHVEWPGKASDQKEGTDETDGSSSDEPSSDGPSSNGSSSGGTSPDGTSPGGAPPSESDGPTSTERDRDTTPSSGSSSPTDYGAPPTDSSPPPSTGGTSPAPPPSPSPTESSEQPSPDPTPTSAPAPTVPSTPPSPSRSTRPPPTPDPDPDPTPPDDSGPPTDTPTSAPDPTSAPPGETVPVDEPAQFMWV